MDDSTIEDLLISYYDGKATADKVREIEAWIKSSDENKKKAMDLYTLLLMTDAQQVAENIDLNKELSKVKGSIQESKHLIPWWSWMQRVAAFLLIPMAITIFMLLYQSGPAAPILTQLYEIRTQPGMITSFRLPDSTLVYLNSGSVLKYPSAFTGHTREVSLDGEAYFEVTKDSTRKFIVSTPQNSKVEVLGTRFNLEAFGNMDEVTTTLLEGKVEFVYRQAGTKRRVIIKPGQKTIYNKKNEEMLLKSTNGASELSWKDMKMIFDRTPMRDALHMLGKRYHVDFRVNTSKYDKYTFTGMFTNQYVDEILENFKISSCIHWRVIKPTEHDQKKRIIEIY